MTIYPRTNNVTVFFVLRVSCIPRANNFGNASACGSGGVFIETPQFEFSVGWFTDFTDFPSQYASSRLRCQTHLTKRLPGAYAHSEYHWLPFATKKPAASCSSLRFVPDTQQCMLSAMDKLLECLCTILPVDQGCSSPHDCAKRIDFQAQLTVSKPDGCQWTPHSARVQSRSDTWARRFIGSNSYRSRSKALVSTGEIYDAVFWWQATLNQHSIKATATTKYFEELLVLAWS